MQSDCSVKGDPASLTTEKGRGAGAQAPDDAAKDVPSAGARDVGRAAKPLRFAKCYGSPDAAARLGRCNEPGGGVTGAGDAGEVR